MRSLMFGLRGGCVAAVAAAGFLLFATPTARADWHGGWHGGGGGWHGGGWGGWRGGGGWGWHGGRWSCCWRGGVFVGIPPVYAGPPAYYPYPYPYPYYPRPYYYAPPYGYGY